MSETNFNLIKHKKIFFALIWLVIFGYVLRDAILVNYEPVLVVLFFYSIYIVYKVKPSINFKPIHIWSGLLFFYWLVAFLVLMYHGGIEGRAQTIMNVVHTVFIFMAIFYAIIALRPSVDYFWYTLIFMGWVLVFLFVINFFAVSFDYSVRVGEAYSNPIRFGVLSNTVLIIMLGSFIWAFNKGYGVLISVLVLAILLFSAVVLSQTRTAWLGFPEAVIAWTMFYIYILAKKYRLNFKHKLLLFAMPFIFLATLYALTPANKVLNDRVGLAFQDARQYISGETFNTSVGMRLMMYEVALEGIKDNPWLGIGENQFQQFLKEKSSYIALDRFGVEFSGLEFNHIHNQYLMAWLTKGVFGILSIVVFFIFLLTFYIKMIPKVEDDFKPVLIAGLVYTIASMIFFMPETPLLRSVQSTNFFLLHTLILAFSYLIYSRSKKN